MAGCVMLGAVLALVMVATATPTASEVHASEVHAKKVHASEVHAKKVHAKKVHAKKVHASEVHAKEVHAKEVHAKRVHASAAPPAQQDKKPPQVIFDIPPISERFEIDGRKNPEMIPQWDVWHAAFELMAAKSDLPTELWKVLSKEEVAQVLQAGKENARNFLACQQRILELVPTLQTEEAKFVNERTQAINLECRWQVLGLRDHVLAALPPLGQTALTQYVESLKAGMRVFVPKKELAFYRQPQ